MEIQLGKQYKTRGGFTVRVVCVNRISELSKPIVGLVFDGVNELLYSFTVTGRVVGGRKIEHEYDLVEEVLSI